jgi:hypothetical protein
MKFIQISSMATLIITIVQSIPLNEAQEVIHQLPSISKIKPARDTNMPIVNKLEIEVG